MRADTKRDRNKRKKKEPEGPGGDLEGLGPRGESPEVPARLRGNFKKYHQTIILRIFPKSILLEMGITGNFIL